VRIFLELAALLVLVGVPAALVAIVYRSGQLRPLSGRRRRTAISRARWQAESRVVDDGTVVAIVKTIPAGGGEESLGQMIVAEIAADDPEWDVKVSQALLDARVRAEILNQEDRPRLAE
jgi:hypothetical protein